jgi:L-asparaginase/Glu-tRNA(Gln) amidotransferase subunit D
LHHHEPPSTTTGRTGGRSSADGKAHRRTTYQKSYIFTVKDLDTMAEIVLIFHLQHSQLLSSSMTEKDYIL